MGEKGCYAQHLVFLSSRSQPYIRPIVRGKAKAPVEFGAKLDMSIDEKGPARLEKLSFDAYNESDVLINAVERYRVRTGRYPERVLADQIYRARKNRACCKKTGYGCLPLRCMVILIFSRCKMAERPV